MRHEGNPPQYEKHGAARGVQRTRSGVFVHRYKLFMILVLLRLVFRLSHEWRRHLLALASTGSVPAYTVLSPIIKILRQ